MTTVFTKIMKGEIYQPIVWEDEDLVAFMDRNPLNPGHLLIVPRVEVPDIHGLDDHVYQKIWTLGRTLSMALKKVTGCKRVGMGVEGFDVPDHVHVHLIPLNGPGELKRENKRASDAELEAMAKKIKKQLEGI